MDTENLLGDQLENLSMQQQFVFCTECGNKLSANVKFCDKCGTKVFNVEDDPQQVAAGDETDPPANEAAHTFDPFLQVEQANAAGYSDEDDGDLLLLNGSPKKPRSPRRTSSIDDGASVPPPPPPKTVIKERRFDVNFNSGPTGLEFRTSGKMLVVSSLPSKQFFKDQIQGAKIRLGDVLLAIDETPCEEASLMDVRQIIKELESNPHTVTFKSKEFIEDEDDDQFEMLFKSKRHVYEPPDHVDMIYGYIERYRGAKMITFHLHRESDDEFVLAASIEANGKGNIVFHNMQHIKFEGTLRDIPQAVQSDSFFGTMTQNLLGTEFVIRDYRIADPSKSSQRGRKIHELGLVKYETNLFGRVPNTLTAVLPRYDDESSHKGQLDTLHNRLQKRSKTRRDIDKSLLESLKQDVAQKDYKAVEVEEMEDLLTFETKKPSWNEEIGAWTLNFNGRVKLASKKNFLLVPEATSEAMDDEFGADTVCLRFGKVLKDRFSLDYRHPISPMQALGICLSTFAKKLAVT